MWVLRVGVTHTRAWCSQRRALGDPDPGKFLRHRCVAETHVAWESQNYYHPGRNFTASPQMSQGRGVMPCRASWRASGGGGEVNRESGYQLGFPAKCVFCSTREVAAPPSRPPSLGKRAPQTPSSDSLQPPRVVENLKEPKFHRGSFSRLSPTLSASPCHPASRVQSRTAPHPPLKVSTLIQSVRGRLRPHPRPQALGPPFRSWDGTCSLSILFSLRVPGA